MRAILCWAGNLYIFAIFGRILLSWFPLAPGGVASQVFSFLYSITEPVLGPLRRAIPAIGMLDISPIIVLFAWRLLLAPAIC